MTDMNMFELALRVISIDRLDHAKQSDKLKTSGVGLGRPTVSSNQRLLLSFGSGMCSSTRVGMEAWQRSVLDRPDLQEAAPNRCLIYLS